MAWNDFSAGGGMQSKYNSGLFKIMRINDSINRAKLLYRKGDLINMNFELDLIWVELESDSKKEEKDKMKIFKEEYRKSLKQLHNTTGMKNKRIILTKISDLLQDKFMYLFNVQKHQRLDKAYVEEDADIF